MHADWLSQATVKHALYILRTVYSQVHVRTLEVIIVEQRLDRIWPAHLGAMC